MFRSNATTDRVVDLNRYRSVSWLQRLAILGCYGVYATVFLSPYGGGFMTTLLVFLLLWAVCMNPKFSTTPFVRHHALQGFIWVFILNALILVSLSGYDVLKALFAFVPVLSNVLNAVALGQWLLLLGIGVKLGGLLLAIVDALRGKQEQPLWLATQAVRRLLYR